jgi:hypothetical protein
MVYFIKIELPGKKKREGEEGEERRKKTPPLPLHPQLCHKASDTPSKASY